MGSLHLKVVIFYLQIVHLLIGIMLKMNKFNILCMVKLLSTKMLFLLHGEIIVGEVAVG